MRLINELIMHLDSYVVNQQETKRNYDVQFKNSNYKERHTKEENINEFFKGL